MPPRGRGPVRRPAPKPTLDPVEAARLRNAQAAAAKAPQIAQPPQPPAVRGINFPIGQAFPRSLAEPGTAAATGRLSLPPTPTFEGGELTVGGAARALTSPYSGRTAVLAAGAVGQAQPTTPSRQASQVVSPYSGRSMANDVYTPIVPVPKATAAQLDYLDRLRAVDPERAAEVARFQSATIGRANPESALATNVFFTETAINNGQLPRNASEQVWNAMAERMGTGITGTQLLEERGYVPIGGGLWYLGTLGGGGGSGEGAASPREIGGGGGGGGGGGFGGDGGFDRFLGSASAGLFNWRIGP